MTTPQLAPLKRLTIKPDARKHANELGLTMVDIERILDNPSRVQPAAQGFRWFISDDMAVLLSPHRNISAVVKTNNIYVTWGINILPKAQEVAESLGFTEAEVQATIESPQSTNPGRSEGSMWHSRDKISVLVGATGVVLVVAKNMAYRDSGLKILPKALAHARANGVSEEDIREALANPESVEPLSKDKLRVSLGGLRVTTTAWGLVLTVTNERSAPSENNEERESEGHKWTPPAEPQEMGKLLVARGFSLRPDGHGRIEVTHRQHPDASVALPVTPKDARWSTNFVASVRKTFNIDLRP
ncbi:hypothetical protein ACWG8W_06265 [Citricoccus zhacaiensis]